MKRLIAIVVVVILLAVWWMGQRGCEETPAVSAAPHEPVKPLPSREEGGTTDAPDSSLVPVAVSAEALRLLDPQATARDDLEVLTVMVEEYRRLLGGNPVGDNDEITAALAGANPKRLALLPASVLKRIAPQGQLLDRWGVAYFFHARSGSSMEIISAGPDGMLHSADDLQGGDPE